MTYAGVGVLRHVTQSSMRRLREQRVVSAIPRHKAPTRKIERVGNQSGTPAIPNAPVPTGALTSEAVRNVRIIGGHHGEADRP